MTVSMPSTPHFDRLLLTGAAGVLGRVLRTGLQPHCTTLRLSDIKPLGDAAAGEELAPARLEAADAMLGLLAGVDAVVHLGGVSTEQPWGAVLPANILGLHNLYEAARRNGVRRIVFASSNHVTGCYGTGQTISPADPARPDGNYGLSKLFGEGLASLYFDRCGIETVSLRIGTATPTPQDRRALSSWLSHADLLRLVLAALGARNVGALVVYGISANTARWYAAEAGWARIGYQPQDNAEAWREQVGHIPVSSDPDSVTNRLQGGSFLDVGPFDAL